MLSGSGKITKYSYYPIVRIVERGERYL